MKKYTVGEAKNILQNRRGNGQKETKIKINITMKQGVMLTETTLALLYATLESLAMHGIESNSEVETEFESGPKWEEGKK